MPLPLQLHADSEAQARLLADAQAGSGAAVAEVEQVPYMDPRHMYYGEDPGIVDSTPYQHSATVLFLISSKSHG